MPYRGDLGQLLVVGLVQHPLLERVQSFVQLEDKPGELGVKRADHRVQRLDRVASKLGPDRTLPHGLEGGAGRAAQRDQESGGVVAVHLDRLAQLLVEAEADGHGSLAVNPQLGTLAKLLRVPGRRPRQPQAAGELVNDLVGGFSMSSQKGWPASTSCATSDGAGLDLDYRPRQIARWGSPAWHALCGPLSMPVIDGRLEMSSC